MIQLTQTALISDPADIPRLSEEFAETGCARLPGFLAPPILKHLLDWLEAARFEERNEVGPAGVFGTTLFVVETEPSLFLLQFILNKKDLYEIAGAVAGCSSIASFIGRMHRTGAGADQHIDWHKDAAAELGRVLGLCINLSTEEYTGGLFQIRDPQLKIRAEIGRTAPGDAFLFRIDREWQHRLTRVESGRRTVGVGWFRSAPAWQEYAPGAARLNQILAGANQAVVSRTEGRGSA